MSLAAGSSGSLVSSSGVFSTTMAGQSTSMWAVLLLLAALGSVSASASMVAVLVMPLAQSAALLVAVMVTVRLAALGMVPNSQTRVPPPAMTMAGVLGSGSVQSSASAPVTVQLWPAGTVSDRVTPLESPVPPAVTVIVKLASSPAVMGVATALLTTDGSGHSTSISPASVDEPSLPAVAVASGLARLPHSPASVVAVTVTCWKVLAAMVLSTQLSTSPAAAWSPLAGSVMVQLARVVDPAGLVTIDQAMGAASSSTSGSTSSRSTSRASAVGLVLRALMTKGA